MTQNKIATRSYDINETENVTELRVVSIVIWTIDILLFEMIKKKDS